jgi:hypothetical protein
MTLREQIKAAFPYSTIQPWLESLILSGTVTFNAAGDEVDASIIFDADGFWDKLEAALSVVDPTRTS